MDNLGEGFRVLAQRRVVAHSLTPVSPPWRRGPSMGPPKCLVQDEGRRKARIAGGRCGSTENTERGASPGKPVPSLKMSASVLLTADGPASVLSTCA